MTRELVLLILAWALAFWSLVYMQGTRDWVIIIYLPYIIIVISPKSGVHGVILKTSTKL